MAETSLDDFFAKKDKSRKKTTKTKEVPVRVDESRLKPAKKDKKKDKDKVNASGTQTNVLSNPQEDEEWRDFEEAKQADYSGLRIQNLQISKEDQDKDREDGDESGNEEDENRDRRDGASGPWNKSGAPGSSAPQQGHASQSDSPSEEPAPKASSKYVPPAQRQGATSAANAAKLPGSRKKTGAPNVNSEEDFPTLGGGAPVSKKWSSQQYSSAVSSDFIDNPNQRQGSGLTLENKFSALQD